MGKTPARYLVPQVLADLDRKMVFVCGPRQVGKTTLAVALPASPRWVFDEIHMYQRWLNWLKGVFDGRPKKQKILVTGSARLDAYRRSGDSLQGRYHLLRSTRSRSPSSG